MPNYSYVINNTFTPFTMDEMVKPLERYSDVYDTTENQYVALQDKAGQLKDIVSALPDGSEAKRQYQNYAGQLEAAADSIMKHGLTMGNRRQLLDLKRRYSGEIGTIEQGLKRQRELVDEQRKLTAQDPTLLFSRRFDTASLDDIIKNPNASYTSYSGNAITKATAAAMQQIANGMMEYRVTGHLDDYNKILVQRTGFTPERILAAIQNPNDPNNGEVFNQVIEGVINTTPIRQWGDNETVRRAYDYAKQGLYAGIGKVNAQRFEDRDAIMDAQLRKQKALYDYQRQYKNQKTDDAITNPYSYEANPNDNLHANPRGIHTPKERTEQTNMINKYGKYFYHDENGWHMNKAGQQELKRQIDSAQGWYKHRRKKPELDYLDNGNPSFATFVHDVLKVPEKDLRMQIVDGKYDFKPETIAAYFGRYHTGYDPHDVTSSVEYTQRIDSSDYNNLISVLNTNAVDGQIDNYEQRKGNDGSYVIGKNDEKIYVGGLTAADIKSAQAVVGMHGNYIEIKVDQNPKSSYNTASNPDLIKTIRIPISTYNQYYSNYITESVVKINAAVQARKDGYTAIQDENGNYVDINALIRREINNMSDNALKSIGTSTVTDKKVSQDPSASYYGFSDWGDDSEE